MPRDFLILGALERSGLVQTVNELPGEVPMRVRYAIFGAALAALSALLAYGPIWP